MKYDNKDSFSKALPRTRDEWCAYMFPRVYLNNRLMHDATMDRDNNMTVENWDTGEVITVMPEDKLEFSIAPDCRYIPDGMRSYSDVMYPEYVALEADKWEFWSEEELYARWPKRPRK